jgi:hypothetical protein
MELVAESIHPFEYAKTVRMIERECCPRQSRKMGSEDLMNRDFRMTQTQERRRTNHHTQMLSLQGRQRVTVCCISEPCKGMRRYGLEKVAAAGLRDLSVPASPV